MICSAARCGLVENAVLDIAGSSFTPIRKFPLWLSIYAGNHA
jgi:hypothetical protein